MLKAVIFDFDGTVCDTLPLCIAAFRKSIEPLAGRRFSDQEITATFGPSEEGTIRALIPEFYEQGVISMQCVPRRLAEFRSCFGSCGGSM